MINNPVEHPEYDLEFNSPLKDLRPAHDMKWVEVLVLDREVKGPDDDEWDNGTVVARFLRKNYADEAYHLAVKLAQHQVAWNGGVLVR